jgi:hypothetical protein
VFVVLLVLFVVAIVFLGGIRRLHTVGAVLLAVAGDLLTEQRTVLVCYPEVNPPPGTAA